MTQRTQIDKRLVKARFQRSFQCHPDAALIQPVMANELLRLLVKVSPRPAYPRVLELGCGSASLAPAMLKHASVDHWTANDLIPGTDRIEEAMRALPLQYFDYAAGDMETMDLPNEQDLILSNAAFQWLSSPITFVTRLIEKLAPGGLLAFSTFGPENLREIRTITGIALAYPPVSVYAQALSQGGDVLCLEQQVSTETFTSPEDILRHLRQTGVNALARKAWTRTDLRRFSASYRSRFSKGDQVELTYHPVYVVFQRQGL